MTNTELILKAGETISLLIEANPDYTKEKLMFMAYMGGLAEGGRIVASQVESYAVVQKAKYPLPHQFGSETMKAIRGK